MPFIRKILFISVTLLILLHTLIPHRHHSEMSYTEDIIAHNKADDIFDFLSLAFHQDSSVYIINSVSNEYFIEKNQLDLFTFLNTPIFTRSYFYSKKTPIFHNSNLKKTTLTVALNGLRAPPYLFFKS